MDSNGRKTLISKVYDDFMQEYYKVLERRKVRWSTTMMKKGVPEKLPKSRMLKRFIRKGIPMVERGKIWMVISGAQDLKEANPDLYNQMLQMKKKSEHSID